MPGGLPRGPGETVPQWCAWSRIGTGRYDGPAHEFAPGEHSGGMTTVTRTFTVQPSPATVIDYLKDFSHAEEWDPGTESCTRLDDGPVVVGSRWHNTSKIAGMSTELTYELTELTGDKIVLVGKNDTATSTDTITVKPHEQGSEITYEAVIEMQGAAKLAAPAVKLVFEKIGSDTEDDMTTVLNQLPRSA
jgi:carbon monoxide dehydrogenase subunit G